MKKYKTNSIFQFLVRVFFSLIVTMMIIVVILFNFMASSAEQNIEKVLQKGVEVIEKELDNKIKLKSEMVDFIQQQNFSASKLYNNQKEVFAEIYQKENQKFESKIVDFLDDAVIVDHNEHVFKILKNKTDDKSYIIYSKKFEKGYVKIVKLLSLEDQYQLENQVINAILISFCSIVMVVLFTFPIVLRQYKKILDEHEQLISSNFNTLIAFGNAVEKRDSDTDEHNYRVAYYALEIAKVLTLPKEFCQTLIKGSILHDIGKIGISDTILLKPSQLSHEEFSTMQKHVELGLEMIRDISCLKETQNIIEYHHEKFDGSGYPKGLKGKHIPLEARIFALVDVFDALTSKRPYKEPFSLEKSLQIITSEKGKHFDPSIVDAFLMISHDVFTFTFNSSKSKLKKILLKEIAQ